MRLPVNKLRAKNEYELLPEVRKRFRIKPGSRKDQLIKDLVPSALESARRNLHVVGGDRSLKGMIGKVNGEMQIEFSEPKTGFIFGAIAGWLLQDFITKVATLIVKWLLRRYNYAA